MEVKTLTTDDELEQISHMTAKFFEKKYGYENAYQFMKMAYNHCPYLKKGMFTHKRRFENCCKTSNT